MKAATGELNLTVITVVAIAAVMLFFTGVLWPNVKKSINDQWNKIDKTAGENGVINDNNPSNP